MTGMSEAKVQELFDSYDPDTEPAMPDGYVQGALAQGRRRVRRRTVGAVATGGVAAVAALAVGGSMLVGGPQPGSAPAPHRAVAVRPTTAVGLLDHVSMVAYQLDVPVRPDQFIYVSETSKFREPVPEDDSPELHREGVDGTIPKGIETEVVGGSSESWLSADGSRQGADKSYGGKGRRRPGQLYSLPPNPHPDMRDPTYAYLATLPTDPAALMKKIRAVAQDIADLKSGQQKLVDYFAFQLISDMVRVGVLPGKLAAALYTDLGRLPGVTLVHDVADAAGRHGAAVAMTDPINGLRDMMIFDRTTYRYLGSRIEERATGRSMYWSAQLAIGVVDKVGQTPR